LNYLPGKYSYGTPTANLNAFINFYSTEERHMFANTGVVMRTYHIYLPPGPLTAGYAVEACWVPPITTPVTDPLSDFPITANQDEPYYFKYTINNDEVIDFYNCCGGDLECERLRVDYLDWQEDEPSVHCMMPVKPEPWTDGGNRMLYMHCESDEYSDSWQAWPLMITPDHPGEPYGYTDGKYRGWLLAFGGYSMPYNQFVYSVWDFEIDLP
jgi:hypothetical protein